MFNFAEATEKAVAAGAAVQVADAASAVKEIAALLGDPARRDTMREAALAFHRVHRGSADRLWAWLAPRLAEAMRDDRAPQPGNVSPGAAG
jgi:3-deoxy-D-manno-octulosonic-acid transferase